MSEKLLAKYHFYKASIRGLLLFAGLWPGCTSRIRYRFLILLNGFVALFVTCAVLNFCYRHIGNRDRLMKAIALLLGYFTIILKAISFIAYRKRLGDLHESLSAAFKRDLANEELRPILLSRLLWFYRPSLILTIVTWAAIAVYWFTPIISIAVQKSRGTKIIKYILPFSTVYPWRIDPQSWRYPAHYALEVYAGIGLAVYASSTDALFGYYAFQISGQLRTLSHRLRNLRTNDDHEKIVRECVVRHEILMRCQDDINQIYGPIVLWLLLTNAIIICALIYQASHLSFRKAIFVGFYIAMKSSQTLVYGSFGTNLMTESDNFRDAVYSCDWPGTGEKNLMNHVLIMLMYKPFILSACGVANISVDMFVNVCNTAMSYFFMLRTLDETADP